MAAAVIYLSLVLLLTPQTVVVAADLKAAATDAKPAITDLKAAAADAKPATKDLKAAAADDKPFATDLKAAAADAKPAATDLKAAALDAKPAATDLKAAASDLKTAAVDRCPPGVGQFLSLNGRQYQKEARIVIKTRRKKGRLFIRI
jgi:hypothetical protein